MKKDIALDPLFGRKTTDEEEKIDLAKIPISELDGYDFRLIKIPKEISMDIGRPLREVEDEIDNHFEIESKTDGHFFLAVLHEGGKHVARLMKE